MESMGLKGFANESCRSNTVIAVNYPEGVDDERFRAIMSDEHG